MTSSITAWFSIASAEVQIHTGLLGFFRLSKFQHLGTSKMSLLSYNQRHECLRSGLQIINPAINFGMDAARTSIEICPNSNV